MDRARLRFSRLDGFTVLVFLLTSHILFAAPDGKSRPPSPKVPEQLDEEEIHRLYSEGEFESILAHFQRFQKAHPAHSIKDSTVIAKYSGVILAANPDKREKAKMHMFRLLTLWPDANFDELLVSDEVDKTFEKVRKEFTAVKAREQSKPHGAEKTAASDTSTKVSQAPTSATSQPPNGSQSVAAKTAPAASENPSKGKTRESKLNRNMIYWLAGGAAAIATTSAMVFLLSPDPKKGEDTAYVVPR